jgi:hypothetical protein
MLRWHMRTEDGAPASPRTSSASVHKRTRTRVSTGASVERIEDAYELFANQRDGVLKVAISAQ